MNESNQINIISPLSTLPIFSPIVWYQPASFMFWNAIVNSAELSSVQLTSNTVAARSMKGLLMATVFIPVTIFGFFPAACPLFKRARYRHSISESSRLMTFFTTCTSDDGEAVSLLGMASNALSTYQYGKGVDRVYHQKHLHHQHKQYVLQLTKRLTNDLRRRYNQDLGGWNGFYPYITKQAYNVETNNNN